MADGRPGGPAGDVADRQAAVLQREWVVIVVDVGLKGVVVVLVALVLMIILWGAFVWLLLFTFFL